MWQNVDEKTEAQDFQFCFIDRQWLKWSEQNNSGKKKTCKGQCDLFRIVDQAMQQQKQNLRKKIPQRNPRFRKQEWISYPV